MFVWMNVDVCVEVRKGYRVEVVLGVDERPLLGRVLESIQLLLAKQQGTERTKDLG